MQTHYVNFCHAGIPFYELSPQELIDFPHVNGSLLPGWSRRVDTEWVCLIPPDYPLPDQGWKIHVSATLDNAERVLTLTSGYCEAAAVMFKFIRGRGVLGRRNSKYGDRSASGKFITIYPVDEASVERILVELGAILDGEDGPGILSDLRWRGGPLYVRYGAFVSRLARTEAGEVTHCMADPEGRLVPDVRGVSFKVPSWVTPPDFLAEALAARYAGTLRDFPFRVTRALHFSNGGGVYEALDTRTDEHVLLKESRPMAGLDELGRDAVARLEQERWALETLTDVECVPRLLDYRIGHEHYFLARRFVPGQPLTQEIYRRNPLVNPNSRFSPAEYVEWAIRIVDQVERGVRAMHARGVVFADLHPNNVLLRADDTIAFIDLETSSAVDSCSPQTIGAPGFRAPTHYRGVDVDIYALGCVRLAMFLPLTIVLPWGPQKIHQLIETIAANFPIPADFTDRVWADLGADAYPGIMAPRSVAGGPCGERSRASLVATLLSTATPRRTDRLFPGDVQQFRLPGAGYTLAYGAAGVLWALAALGEEVDPGHVSWLTSAVDRDDAPRPGCYDGLAGVAYALDHLGHLNAATGLLDRALALPRDGIDDTFFGGLAGLGVAVVHFARRTGDEGLLKHAWEIADSLGERGDRVSPGGGRVGLLHGSSGIGLFLSRLYAETGEDALLRRARQAVHADLATLGWKPGERRSRAERPCATTAQDAPQWRQPLLMGGCAGVGMVARDLTDAYTHRGWVDTATVEAVAAIREALSVRFLANAGLFRGRAGAMLALRYLDDASPDVTDALREHVNNLDWHAVPLNGGLSFLGDHNLRISVDLGSGAAGVLLALHAALSGEVLLPFFHRPPGFGFPLQG